MRKGSLSVFAAMVMALIVSTSAVAASSIANGSFEKDVSVGQFQTLPTGSTAIDGWTVATGTVDWIGTYWVHADGTKSVDLNGTSPGSVSQALATTADYDYVVSFHLAGNPACAPTTKTLSVSVTGGPTTSYSFDTTGRSRGDMGWTLRTYSFTAAETTGNAVLTFSSTTSGTCGPAVDMVSLTETAPPPPPITTPATADDCKKGGWQSMHDATGSAFRNQGDCVSYVATDGRNSAAGAR